MKAADTSKMNKYEKFVAQLPFSVTHINSFWNALVAAKNVCGNEDFVTLEALAKVLNSPSWQ